MLKGKPAVSLQRSWVQDAAGLVTMAPQPPQLAACIVWLGTGKPSWLVSSRASSYPTSPPWTCIAPKSCPIPGADPETPHFCASWLWPGGLSPHSFLLLCKVDIIVLAATADRQPHHRKAQVALLRPAPTPVGWSLHPPIRRFCHHPCLWHQGGLRTVVTSRQRQACHSAQCWPLVPIPLALSRLPAHGVRGREGGLRPGQSGFGGGEEKNQCERRAPREPGREAGTLTSPHCPVNSVPPLRMCRSCCLELPSALG